MTCMFVSTLLVGLIILGVNEVAYDFNFYFPMQSPPVCID